MKCSTCFSMMLVAGTIVAAPALAQKSVAPAKQAVAKKTGLHLVSAVPQVGRAPDAVRSVAWVDGHIVALSDWQPYHGGGSATDNPPAYVFDAIQDAPGVTPGTNPTTGRYTFYLDAPGDSYTTAVRNFDMAGIPAAAQGHGATACDFLIREQDTTSQPLFVGIFTAETADMNTAPGASWGFFPGIQFTWNTGIGAGFWFIPADVSTQPPPVGDGWMMPVDGAGAYQFVYTRDAAGTVVAQSLQPGCWGTGNYMQPPVAKVGTQGLVGQDDESAPPNCGAISIATNNCNLIVEQTCETYAWGPFVVPSPAPTTLSPAIGFGMKVATATGACCTSSGCQVLTSAACTSAGGTYNGDNTTCSGAGQPSSCCYANCDGSSTTPCLNVLDFGCFLNSFAAGNTYANCDHSTTAPVLNVLDFGCFLNKFAAGCSNC